MTLDQRKKLAAHIQRLLKVRRVSFHIANTEKGPLSLTYTKDAQDFEIILDAVPLNMNDYDSRELKSLLEKYLFKKEEDAFRIPAAFGGLEIVPDSVETKKGIEKKKRGRPAKSK